MKASRLRPAWRWPSRNGWLVLGAVTAPWAAALTRQTDLVAIVTAMLIFNLARTPGRAAVAVALTYASSIGAGTWMFTADVALLGDAPLASMLAIAAVWSLYSVIPPRTAAKVGATAACGVVLTLTLLELSMTSSGWVAFATIMICAVIAGLAVECATQPEEGGAEDEPDAR